MNNKPNEPKKRFPGGFFVFLLAALLVILTVQNLTHEKKGKVSFSHQLEHLVNLNLIHKDASKKVALNDNLVAFHGRFKDELTNESKYRYRFLEILNENHELKEGQERIAQDLTKLQSSIKESAVRFLQLSGTAIPKSGYVVIGSAYDSAERENATIIRSVPTTDTLNFPEVKHLFSEASKSPTVENVKSVGSELSLLIQSFRSSTLGIGSEAIKKELKSIDESVSKSLDPNSTLTPRESLALYQNGIFSLNKVILSLNDPVEGVRLSQLRSVRDYLVSLEQYNSLSETLEKNGSQLSNARKNVADVTWFFNDKELSTRALEKQNFEEYNRWFAGTKLEWENFPSNQGLFFKAPDQPRNTVLEKTFKSQQPSPNYFSYLFTILPVVLVVLLLYFVFSKQMKGMGSGGAMNFGKSPAKMLNKSLNKITFKDVAGVEEAKEELVEIVDFLKDPSRYTALGAKIPKGVLCIGPPGTGKTLIAKAVAGEADRPFFSISGSDFVEMFVGVGASRIRDLFAQAKKSAPCIIFIDEIDAVGRHRGAGIGGGHDEREQTLNQLLVEMDGFETNEGVILMAATNRPDVLDKALLRPGRFDRSVILDLPDIKGRLEILKVHARKIKLDGNVDLSAIARATPGSSGADLMNILNEAALLAARRGRSAVTGQDALDACDKVIYGKERRSLQLDEKEKLHTAFHESGHAVVGLTVDHSDPVEKVTIIPRGMSLGATYFIPEKNKTSYWKKEMTDKLAVLMGGRIAEEIFINDFSSGAQMDISQATKLARAMICEWGMSKTLGAVAYNEQSTAGQYLQNSPPERHYSEETAKIIDQEVKELLESANKRAEEIIIANKEKVQLMTDMLMQFETLDKEDVLAIMDGSWDTQKKEDRVKDIEGAHRQEPPPPPKLEGDVKDTPPDFNPSPQGT